MGNDLFEKAPIPKAYFSFALPVVFSMVISLVYNMADTYFIAATGNTNLVAGVSLGAPIFTLMIALGDIFGLGGSSVISRLFGKKMDEDGKRLSVFCFYGAIVCGIVVAVLMMLFRAPILTLLGAKADTVQYASDYYTWLVIGAPFIILSFTPSNLLHGSSRCSDSHGNRKHRCGVIFCIFLTDKKQTFVHQSKRIFYQQKRTWRYLCHRNTGICYQLYAESWNCAD